MLGPGAPVELGLQRRRGRGRRRSRLAPCSPVGVLAVDTTATVRSAEAPSRLDGDEPDQEIEHQVHVGRAGGESCWCPRPGWWRCAGRTPPARPSATGRSGRDPPTYLPSRVAAVPRICDTVTTPVPPTPGMRMVTSCGGHHHASAPSSDARRARACVGRRPRPGWPSCCPTSASGTTEGTTGSHRRGRSSPCCRRTGGSGSCDRTRSRSAAPTGSWTGTPQSPQPSQTRSLITMRSARVRSRCPACGRGASPPRTADRGSAR